VGNKKGNPETKQAGPNPNLAFRFFSNCPAMIRIRPLRWIGQNTKTITYHPVASPCVAICIDGHANCCTLHCISDLRRGKSPNFGGTMFAKDEVAGHDSSNQLHNE
jgi:hypothetical protein